jgi:hypothetical protein
VIPDVEIDKHANRDAFSSRRLLIKASLQRVIHHHAHVRTLTNERRNAVRLHR